MHFHVNVSQSSLDTVNKHFPLSLCVTPGELPLSEKVKFVEIFAMLAVLCSWDSMDVHEVVHLAVFLVLLTPWVRKDLGLKKLQSCHISLISVAWHPNHVPGCSHTGNDLRDVGGFHSWWYPGIQLQYKEGKQILRKCLTAVSRNSICILWDIFAPVLYCYWQRYMGFSLHKNLCFQAFYRQTKHGELILLDLRLVTHTSAHPHDGW